VTNALPARKDSRVRETVLSPVAPQGFPGQTNLIDFGFDGFPDPLHASPGLELLKSAAFFIDAANAKDGDAYAFNKGTGGFALDARYGSSLAIGASDTNDPLLLPWTGENYVYLPGSASNTIACTAPVGTASYAAYPTGGGAATTGAAVAGAFTLQTTGSWIRVDILDAGTAVIASFVAANSTSTGYTDAFAVVWTINRATAGRKSVAVTRPVWLFGTDDYMEVPNNALLNMDASQSFTVLAVVRQWATPTSYGRYVDKKNGGGIGVGYSLSNELTNFTSVSFLGDGVNQLGRPGTALVAGAASVVIGVTDRTAQTQTTYANTTASATTSTAAVGALTNALPMRIGISAVSLGSAQDFELLAVAVFRRALTATEIASINTYYGTA
jgi:hypothetical protein